MSNGWQPIETAPKDGTQIVAYVGDGKWLQLSYFKYNGLAAWRDWDMDYCKPTHWLPLPEFPNPNEQYQDRIYEEYDQ